LVPVPQERTAPAIDVKHSAERKAMIDRVRSRSIKKQPAALKIS
jgi:hypothetical protein